MICVMKILNGKYGYLLKDEEKNMKVIKTDVCVIGAGAGGTGCVYRLIKKRNKNRCCR